MDNGARPLILCVDDDPLLLQGLATNLGRHFSIRTAQSGAEGLKVLSSGEPFVAVVSDMHMGGMDGATFLSRVRQVTPETVRLVLTGNASLSAAIAAINDGYIFRLLTKPCPTKRLVATLWDAVEQYRLVTRDRQLMDQKVQGLTEQLLRAERLATLGTVARGVGHELNNLSTLYEFSLDFIEQAVSGGAPPASEDLKQLRATTDRLKRHASQLMRFGRPDEERNSVFDLCELASDVVALVRPMTMGTKLSVNLQLPPSSVVICSNRARLEQVLINLIKNAVEATAEVAGRSRRVWVRVRSDQALGVARCEVEDNGCGIAAEVQHKIFDSYFTTKPADRGTGLGLSVVKEIVEACEGALSFSTELGRGTVFRLELPATCGQQVAQQQ